MPPAPLTLAAPTVPDPMEAPPIRWGVLGPGGIANTFADAVHEGTRSRVVAVGSRSLERARDFAERHRVERAHGSYADLVADAEVDAVYVASPHSEHHDHEADNVKNVVHVLPPSRSISFSSSRIRYRTAACEPAQALCQRDSPCDRFVRSPDVAPLRESTHRGGSDRNPSSEPITGLPCTLTGRISLPKWT